MIERQFPAARRAGLSFVVALLLGLQPVPAAAAAPATSPLAGQVVAHGPVLRVNRPEASSYVARGTLPLPPGWQYDPAASPFGLRRNGIVYPAQWSPVAYDADGSLAVVELAAVVDGTPGGVGPTTFEVVRSEPGFPTLYPDVPAETLAAIGLTGEILLRVTDSLGAVYVGFLSQNLSLDSSEVEVMGRAKGVYATRGKLLRLSGPPNSLPVLGGFHAWFTVHSGDRTVELDLQWHNATVCSPLEMAPNVLFEKVELLLPSGWRSLTKWPSPVLGSTAEQSLYGKTRAVVPLIADGPTPHVLRQRGHLTWRHTLYPAGQQAQATERHNQFGWGVVRGQVNGWQDPLCARWLAQQTLLPDLSHWQGSYQTELTQRRQEIELALSTGNAYYYTGVAQMGPYHSYGSAYGGMTGGSEIDQTPGAALMWTGNPDGLVATQMLHRMVLDRQYGWFYDAQGELIVADDLVDAQGHLPVDLFSNEFIEVPNNGALGFELTPNLYAAVQPRPTYEGVFLGTTPYNGLEQHDAQHGARATWPMKVLVWAANDRMARHDLIAQAALWQMELHHGPGGRLDGLRLWAQAHPGVAGEFGRGEGWMIDGVAHWYALTEPSQRTHLDPWFAEVQTVLELLRSPLDVFYGNRYGKITEYYSFNKQFAIIQWYEHEIVLHAIACVLESCTADPVDRLQLGRFLVEGTLACWRYGWKPLTNGTWEQQAVAPIDPNLPAYASLAQIPSTGFGGGPVSDQLAGPMGYAMPHATLTEIYELYTMAQALNGNVDALQGFKNLYTYYLAIENRAPLLAWLQFLHGE